MILNSEQNPVQDSEGNSDIIPVQNSKENPVQDSKMNPSQDF